MPRSTKDVTFFNNGIISAVPYSDIPDGAMTYTYPVVSTMSYGVDPNADGRIQGLPISTVYSASLGNQVSNINAWIKKNDGKWTLVFAEYSSSNTGVIEDFYGTPSETLSLYAAKATTIIARNQEAYVGTGGTARWIGYCGKDQFNKYTAPTAIQSLEQRVSHIQGSSDGQIAITASTGHVGTAAFTNNQTYYWGFSVIYDGYQESPLYYTSTGHYVEAIGINNYDYITITITAYGAEKASNPFNPRITGLRVYRSVSTTNAYEDREFYRLIKEIDIDDASWTVSGTNRTYSFDDHNSISGASYEAHTGIAETLSYTYINYGISAEVNDYHFVSNVGYIPANNFPDAEHFLIRSKRGRFSIFDWTKDFLRLPTIPVAMAGYGGKLFVWDESRTYVVNPEGLFIEDTLEGAGCSSHACWVATDYGLFWTDGNHAFRFFGNDLRTISAPIHGDLGAIYQVIFDGENQLIIFITENLSKGMYAWLYHVIKERWDFTDIFAHTGVAYYTRGAVAGKNGEVYAFTDNTGTAEIVKVFGGSTNRAWRFSGKEFNFGKASQPKKWYYFRINKVETSGTITSFYAKDGNYAQTHLIDSDNKIDDLSGDWIKANKLKFVIVGSAGVNYVNDFEIVYRPMIGDR